MMIEKRLKVLHIIDSLGIGGAETLLVNTINDLNDFDHVLVVLNLPEDLKKTIQASVKYYCLRFRPILFAGTWFRLRKIVKKEAPDIIHSHLFWSTILGRISKKKQTKFFFTLHGMMGSRLFKHNTLYRELEKITLSRKQHMIAVSRSVHDDYIKYIPFKGKSYIIYNYVPDVFFQNKKNDFSCDHMFRMIAVGSLKKIKNHRILIQALSLLDKKFVLDIYGEGELKSELTTLINQFGVKVFLKENAKNLRHVLSTYDLFVMPSLSEGNSLALLEAMVCRMPLLLSNIPSFREVTAEKAVYFNNLDEKDLAAKIELLHSDQSLREQIADDNYKIALKKATRDKFIQDLSSIYISD